MPRTFSGEPTTDPRALDDALAAARSVRITTGGCLVYAVHPRGMNVLDPETEKYVSIYEMDVVAHLSDPAELAELRRLMVPDTFTNTACMCPGDLAFEFLDAQGERVTVVRYDQPGGLDWPLWKGRAWVRDAAALQQWLLGHGADPRRLGLEPWRPATPSGDSPVNDSR